MRLPRLPYLEDKVFGCVFFIVLLVPLVFSLITLENFETIKFVLLLIFAGAGAVALFAAKQVFGYTFRGPKSFYYFLGLFWLWAVLATIFSWDKNYSFFGFAGRFTNGLIFYSVWAVFLILLNSLEQIKIDFLLKTTVLVSGLVAFWGLVQSMGVGFYLGLDSGFFNRAAPSFLGNTDFSSMFVAAALPLAVLFFYRSQVFRGKVYYALNGFIQLCALAIFASRGAFVGLLAGLVGTLGLIFYFKRQKAVKWAAVIFLASAMVLFLGSRFLNYSRPSLNLNDQNVSYRLNVWQLALGSIAKRPVFGVGLGSFQLMFEHDRPAVLINGGFFDDAHNLPLELATTGGVLFLIWFLCLLIVAGVTAWRRLKQHPEPEDLAIMASLGIWFTSSLFTPVVIPCYILLAVLLSACFRNTVNLGISKSSKIIFQSLGTALAVYGCIFFAAEILFFAGVGSYDLGNYQLAYKETTMATFLNPSNRSYFMFRTGSAIRAGLPLTKLDNLFAQTQQLNSRRALSYQQDANLYYLMLYQTRNVAYMSLIRNNLQIAIKLDPYQAGNYFSLSSYEYVFGNLPAAQRAVQNGLRLDPNFSQGQIFLAKICQLQNNKQGTLEALKAAILLEPNNLTFPKMWRAINEAKDIRTIPFNVNLDVGRLN